MKKLVMATMPIVVSTVLIGCGSETIVKTRSDKSLKNSQIIIVKPSENSIFDSKVQLDLQSNILSTYNHHGVMYDKSGVNKRPDEIASIESRINYIEGLGLSDKVEEQIVTKFNKIITYHGKMTEIENSISDEVLWDIYSNRKYNGSLAEYVPHLKNALDLREKYDDYIKPYNDLVDNAKLDMNKSRDAYRSQVKAVKDKMFEYVLDNEIPIQRNKLYVFNATHKYSISDNACPISDYYTGISMQTILNKENGTCHYSMHINNTDAVLTKEQNEAINEIVVNNNDTLSKAYVNMLESDAILDAAKEQLNQRKVIANNKFDNIGRSITGSRLHKVARALSKKTGGYFNAETLRWGNTGEKGFGYVVSAFIMSNGLESDVALPIELLSSKDLFLAYDDLLIKELNNATFNDSVDSDGNTDIVKSDFVNAIKFLETNKDSDDKSYIILSESKDDEGVRILKEAKVARSLHDVPLLVSGLPDYQKEPYRRAISYCAYSTSECLN